MMKTMIRICVLAALLLSQACSRKHQDSSAQSQTSAPQAGQQTPATSFMMPRDGAGGQLTLKQSLPSFCESLNKKFKNFGWNSVSCNPNELKVGGISTSGLPLIYAEYGASQNKDVKTTLLFCGVHGDELSSVYLCFGMMTADSLKHLDNHRVVIAPLVNPDGFFANPPTRTNGRGVDLNRNFQTADWKTKALKEWKEQEKQNKRKFPGNEPNSEPETLFQLGLLNSHKPDKIISAHAPLRLIDYDGPADQTHYGLERRENRARFLAMNISKNSRFPLVDYRFYPGSLGNYAGKERGIPTYTLELPTSNAVKAKEIWQRFEYSLTRAVRFDVTDQSAQDISATFED